MQQAGAQIGCVVVSDVASFDATDFLKSVVYYSKKLVPKFSWQTDVQPLASTQSILPFSSISSKTSPNDFLANRPTALWGQSNQKFHLVELHLHQVASMFEPCELRVSGHLKLVTKKNKYFVIPVFSLLTYFFNFKQEPSLTVLPESTAVKLL